MLTDEEFRGVLVSIRDEGKTILEIPVGGKPVMGASDPHRVEYVRRRLAQMMEVGEVELLSKEIVNATGSRRRTVQTSAYHLTPKGVQVLRRINEELEKVR